MVTVALLPPFVNVIKTCAEIPIPCTLKLQFTLPRLSVVTFTSEVVPSTVTPPIPLGPGYGVLNATCTVALCPFNITKLVLDDTKAVWPRLKIT